jgi:hypothetical protein
MKEKIKAFIDKQVWLKLTGYFFIDCLGWVRSLFIFLFRRIRKPGVFYGYCNYYWSQKYADKRAKKWPAKWDQSGKQQGVIPVGDIKLLVCSKLELKTLQKKGLANKNLNARKAIKKSYYLTKV